jgi:formylglycine-generating enzyme required for sulfatase activity
VSSERLIDSLWGERPPSTAAKLLQIYVSQLRKILPEERLRTRPPGYLLEVERDEVDSQHFERLLDEGRAALATGNATLARSRLTGALSLWRGPALADFADDEFAQERPVRRVAVDGFWMDEHPVTAADFRRFVRETGYVTVAERPLRNAADSTAMQSTWCSLVGRPAGRAADQGRLASSAWSGRTA